VQERLAGPAAARKTPEPIVEQVHDQLTAIMAVSRAVAEGRALEETLAMIAEAGASMARAESAAIVLRERESTTGLAVAGSYGLSPEYAQELNSVRPIEVGHGPSGVAAATRKPVPVSDVFEDPIFGPWRNLAAQEHYRAMVSVPLQLGSGRRVIGVLNAYRRRTGEWAPEEIELLVSLADHAAIAIQTAQLLDESRRQVRGLSLLVRSLRAQSHEHANLVHAIYGLLAIDEVGEAQQLIAAADDRYRLAHAQVSDNIENSLVSGFLLAESAIAGNGGVRVEIDPGSSLWAVPPTLTDLDAITILGNLIHNANEAVLEVEDESRRRVSVLIAGRDDGLVIRVRDWGPGIPPDSVGRVFTAGYSTKPDHVGVGLSLVRSIVQRAGGEISIDSAVSPGTAFHVHIPA
jgi:signal transduction histidine kinase